DTDFDGCMALVQRLTEDKGVYLANSMNSLRIEGQKTISIEMVQQFDWEVPDTIVIPGGNLGNVSALGARFEIMHDLRLISRLTARSERIAVAQSEPATAPSQGYMEGCAPCRAVPARKVAAGAIKIGNPVSVQKAIRNVKKFGGIVEQASQDNLANAAALAAR